MLAHIQVGASYACEFLLRFDDEEKQGLFWTIEMSSYNPHSPRWRNSLALS